MVSVLTMALVVFGTIVALLSPICLAVFLAVRCHPLVSLVLVLAYGSLLFSILLHL